MLRSVMRATLYRGSGARRNELMGSGAVGIALGGFGLFGWGDGAGTKPLLVLGRMLDTLDGDTASFSLGKHSAWSTRRYQR
jgi:hypothetical protein